MKIFHVRRIRHDGRKKSAPDTGKENLEGRRGEKEEERKKAREIEVKEHCVVVCYKLITCGWLESD